MRACLREAVVRGASLHSLRHTLAPHHVVEGMSLRTEQWVLGHPSLEANSLDVRLAQEAPHLG